MGKLIKMSRNDIERMVEEFRNTLYGNPQISGGKIVYEKTLDDKARKATIHFTEKAHLKMMKLLEKFDSEVAWHGLAFRDEDPNKDDYYITDIMVYPQEVTGATVTTDQNKYMMWLYSHDDNTFPHIRFQGHSHVRMSVGASAVDEALYDSLIGQLGDDDFYIFGIWNKNNARNVSIYDMKKNMLFTNEDVSIDIIDDGTGIIEFLKNATEMVVDKKPAYPTYGSQYPRGTTAYGGTTTSTKPNNPVTPAPKNAAKTGGKKRVDPETARLALSNKSRVADDDEPVDDGYDDSPYSAFGHT